MGRFEGKVAVITGAGAGIGAATAALLAAEGAAVVLVDIDDAGLERTGSAVEAAGGRVLAVHADITDEGAVRQAMASAVATFGGIDVLHNNAGAASPEAVALDRPLAEADLGVWERMLAVNLLGTVLGCKHAIPAMVERGGGAIVNTASIAAFEAGPAAVAYGASKAAVVSLTRHVAARYGKQGIRCVTVVPGLVVDPERHRAPPWFLATMERHVATPRLGRPDDIARAVAFLASEDAGFITGISLPVDGGFMSHRASFADELDHELATAAAPDDERG